jgi:thioredoxin 1
MPKELTNDDFDKEVLQAKGLVIVDFWAVWCAPCRALSPMLEQIADEVGDKADVVKVNVDENQELAMKYGIQGIPTVKLFKDGEEVQTLIGLMPKAEYLKYIDKFA